MALFYRADGWVKNVMGQAIAGAQIFVCLQPADIAYVPPVPLANIFADPAGLVPITQPIFSDNYGHYDYYAATDTPYTEVVVHHGTVQVAYPDQVPMGATLGIPSGVGTVTNNEGPLTAGQLIVGTGGADIMTGPVFPGDATMFLNGTGVFSVPAGGGGAVDSVFGRTGVVTAQTGDYNFSQISGALGLGQIPAGGSSTTFLRGDGVWATPASGSGTVTSVAAGTGLTASPSPITSSGTLSITNTAVTPGSYTSANITVNQQGQITAAANGSGGSAGFTTQNVYNSSGRVIGTTYQNTSGKTMQVTVGCNGSGGGGLSVLTAQSDSSATPTTYVGILETTNNTFIGMVTFMVLNGNYYLVGCSNYTSIGVWIEWV